jgi:hypothetical protein
MRQAISFLVVALAAVVIAAPAQTESEPPLKARG